MMKIGRLCTKTHGRDAGKKAVIIAIIDKNNVIIDGETRRRKCNTAHLEPLQQTIEIEENASHEKITEEFKKLGTELKEKKKKQKQEQTIVPEKSKKTKAAKK